MWGQWIGASGSGADAMSIVLNINRDQDNCGRLHLSPVTDKRLPSIRGVVKFDGDRAGSRADAVIEIFSPLPADTSQPTIKLTIDYVDAKLLELNFNTNWYFVGACKLERQEEDAWTPPSVRLDSWLDYRKWVESLPNRERNLIFRGQSQPWPLQSSFHRTGRRDLTKYNQDDIPHLQNAVAPMLGNWITDTTDGKRFGALLALGQHHGFPTPLIDWTESPYVAAFFAFADPLPERSHLDPSTTSEPCARIFALDRKPLHAPGYFAGIQNPDPYIAVHNFIPVDNPRAAPQQSVSISTNLAAPERWLRRLETKGNPGLLRTVDIPSRFRDEAMSDLAYMGISAASMFPGLDGACRAARERCFSAKVR
jgi:hypothetical protein